MKEDDGGGGHHRQLMLHHYAVLLVSVFYSKTLKDSAGTRHVAIVDCLWLSRVELEGSAHF